MDSSAFALLLEKKLHARAEQRIKDAQNAVSIDRHRWIYSNVLKTALEELIADRGLLEECGGGEELGKAVQQRLTEVKSQQLTSAAGDSAVLTTRKELPPLSADEQNALHTALAKYMQKKLLGISNFYQPTHPSAGDALLKAKASQLPSIVSRDAKLIQETEEASKKLQEKDLQLTKTLHQTYSEALRLCDSILSTYKLKIMPEFEENQNGYLSVKAEAFTAKLKALEAQLLSESYTPEIVRELTTIRIALDRKVKETRIELDNAETQYRACLSAGTDFQRIAKEYTAIKKDIEARTWALKELESARKHHS